MRKIVICSLLSLTLMVCMGAKGIVSVDESEPQGEETVAMYSEDGRRQEFDSKEAEKQKSVGWYDKFSDVLATMWKEDGSSIVVYKGDINKYKKEGYTDNYSSVFSKVFKPETGEVKDVLRSEVESYIGEGWKRGTGKFDPNGPMVALTFDDGPATDTTKRLLDTLEENNAHATFFMLGNRMNKAEDNVKRMREIGCETGSHTYDHTDLTSIPKDAAKEQFEMTEKSLNDITGEAPSVVRPAYGSYNDTVKDLAKEFGEPIVLWSIDTLDWDSKDADAIFEKVMSNVSDGDIILLHDIYESTADAAERLIPALMDEGYQLVTVTEMGKAKIGGLEPGKVYTDLWPSTVEKLKNSDESESSPSPKPTGEQRSER